MIAFAFDCFYLLVVVAGACTVVLGVAFVVIWVHDRRAERRTRRQVERMFARPYDQDDPLECAYNLPAHLPRKPVR